MNSLKKMTTIIFNNNNNINNNNIKIKPMTIATNNSYCYQKHYKDHNKNNHQ